MNTINQTRWVFGYGSLMWRPGFEFTHSAQATLRGFSRSLCVYSHVHRGTPEKPGLVFGLDQLDQSDLCKGIAFQVDESHWQHTVDYLRAREQVTTVYLEEIVSIQLAGEKDQTVNALTYRVDTSHKQYAGQLGLDEQLKFIRQGRGQSGDCREYILSTADHLNELKVEDKNLQALASALS